MRADPIAVIAAARSWEGTPYHHQQSVKGAGCDCLGLVRGVWREVVGHEPIPVPPYTRDWGEVGNTEPLVASARKVLIEIEPADAGPGAVVIFRMARHVVAKHCGILTTPRDFIHAVPDRAVREEPLSVAWRWRIACAVVFPARQGAVEG